MTVRTVTSKDGTRIAFDRIGEGPPVIFVGGALNDRTFPPLVELAERLAPRFTAYNYDRRGRGQSGDTSPYEVAREVEDLQALIAEVGGRASVYGLSSGAVLALEAAARGAPIDRLALFEPPLDVEGGGTSEGETAQLAELVAAGRRGQAVELFLSGILPAEVIAEMKRSPMWSEYESMAPTLVYEGLITGDRSLVNDRLRSVTIPAVVITGSDSDPYLRKAVEAVVDALPQGELLTVPGAHHSVSAEDLASVLVEIFGGGRRPADPSSGRASSRR